MVNAAISGMDAHQEAGRQLLGDKQKQDDLMEILKALRMYEQLRARAVG